MKNIYNKINNTWFKYRKWSESNIIGHVTSGLVRISLITGIFVLAYFIFESPKTKDILAETSNGCNVPILKIHGTLVTYIPSDNTKDMTSSEDITSAIRGANNDDSIKAIVVEVDSSGGSLVAGDEISKAIKASVKPVIAYVREIGASSSYWAISSADKIYASKNSDVGSIGVTASYLNEVDKNKQEGFQYERLVSGVFKDTGVVARKLTDAERAYLMKNLNINFTNFKEDISINRNIPIEQVNELSTGATFPGVNALGLGLIDEIGGIDEVSAFLEQELHEKVEFCY